MKHIIHIKTNNINHHSHIKQIITILQNLKQQITIKISQDQRFYLNLDLIIDKTFLELNNIFETLEEEGKYLKDLI
jgi:hypothetical protein